MEDLTGLVFNDLTAVRSVGHKKGFGQVWTWRCICGKEVDYAVRKVKSGHTLSCGCRRHRNCESKKICRHCGEISYYKNRHGNFASVCQKCRNKQGNKSNVLQPKKFMVLCARTRAKKAGVPCAITHEDFEIPEFCPILGIRLEQGTRKAHDASPSLDRVIPERGYVSDNIAVISHRANMIKSSGSAEEHRKIADWMDAQNIKWNPDFNGETEVEGVVWENVGPIPLTGNEAGR